MPKINHHCINRFCVVASLIVSGFVATPESRATIIVDWGGDYVSAGTPLLGTPASSSGSTTYAYSDTAVKSPAGPNFYGAFSLTNGSGTGTPEFSLFSLANSTPPANDSIRLAATAGSGSLTARGLIFFKKEDFLGGASAGAVTFGESSALTINVTSSAPGGTGNTRQTRAAVHALVNGEWNWYVSQGARAGTSEYVFSTGLETWALYDIGASTAPLANAPVSSASYNVPGTAFEDIDSVGFFFNYVAGSAGTSFSLYVSSIEVDAQAVPEPAVTSALFFGSLLVFIGYRVQAAAKSASK